MQLTLRCHVFRNLVGDKDDVFYGMLHLLGTGNAITNPILYGYYNENFRNEYKMVYRRMPWHRQSLSSGQQLRLQPQVRPLRRSVRVNDLINSSGNSPAFVLPASAETAQIVAQPLMDAVEIVADNVDKSVQVNGRPPQPLARGQSLVERACQNSPIRIARLNSEYFKYKAISKRNNNVSVSSDNNVNEANNYLNDVIVIETPNSNGAISSNSETVV